MFHDCRGFQHLTAGVAGTEMNFISSFYSSLASRILRLSFSPRLFLLWCWAFSGKNHCRSLLFLGVASTVKSSPSLLALLGCRFSEVNLCSVILWRWDFCGEFCNGAFFFFGIENPAPEITAVPCTSLVLGCSAINSTQLVYSSATSLQGEKWCLSYASDRQWNEKIPRWNRVVGFVLRWLFHYRHTNSQITTNSNSFASLTGRHCVPPFN